MNKKIAVITDMLRSEPFINKQILMELIKHPNQNSLFENIDSSSIIPQHK